LQALRDFYLH